MFIVLDNHTLEDAGLACQESGPLIGEEPHRLFTTGSEMGVIETVGSGFRVRYFLLSGVGKQMLVLNKSEMISPTELSVGMFGRALWDVVTTELVFLSEGNEIIIGGENFVIKQTDGKVGTWVCWGYVVTC